MSVASVIFFNTVCTSSTLCAPLLPYANSMFVTEREISVNWTIAKVKDLDETNKKRACFISLSQ